jgi:UDP-N-acetylmuramoyl-L-alanyl-D-glutamate--2,6-diaminopimelate ligase
MHLHSLIKTYIPKPILNARHFAIEYRAAQRYGFPSNEIQVIGITGTSGKSTTTSFLRIMLESLGYTVGSLSTIDFSIAGQDQLNDQKMTMLGRGQIQRYLRKMIDQGCDIALVETTSEGFLQHRHRFVAYDHMIMTNLYPEHIDSHGSFEAYKQAKLGIVAHAMQTHPKKSALLPHGKQLVLNANMKEVAEFFALRGEATVQWFGRDDETRFDVAGEGTMQLARDIATTAQGTMAMINGTAWTGNFFGEHNMMNALAAMAMLRGLGHTEEEVRTAATHLRNVPGRLERIEEAAAYGFQVMVDYAFEPVAMNNLYAIVEHIAPKRILHVLGSTGGGRDIERRFTVGEFVGTRADLVYVTDEDPYDDDPRAIMDDVMSAVCKAGKQQNKTAWIIEDRREAITRAIADAREGDLVLITGKGSEQAMVVKGELIPWDDRAVARDALAARGVY